MTNVYEEAKVFLENFVPNESNLDVDLQAVAEQEKLVLSFPRRDYLPETHPNLSAEEHLHRLSDLIKLRDSLSAIGVLKINEGAAGLAAGIQKGIDWLNK